MKTKPKGHTPRDPEELASDTARSGSADPIPVKDHAAPITLKQILVPIDFSDCSLRALDYAVALAVSFGARLTLLHVVEPAPVAPNYLGMTPPLDETNQNLVEASRERLAVLARKRIGPHLRNDTLVRMGRAHSEITDTASALGSDLIVIGTQGHTGVQHILLGSTAERVVRHAACPVLAVRYPGSNAAG